MEITESKTARGFKLMSFVDRNNEICSIQESSIATESCIWIGVDDPNPRIMCSDARKLGLRDMKEDPEENVGWCPFDVPKEVLMSTRMHLTVEQVKALLPILTKFVETEEL